MKTSVITFNAYMVSSHASFTQKDPDFNSRSHFGHNLLKFPLAFVELLYSRS